MKQQRPQEEEIPRQAMMALKISKNTTLDVINLMISLLGRQIKTLTNQAEILISQQGMPQNPENIFVAMLALLAFASPAQADLIDHTYWAYITNPPPLPASFYCRL